MGRVEGLTGRIRRHAGEETDYRSIRLAAAHGIEPGQWSCTICPAWRGENATNRRPPRDDRGKNHRRRYRSDARKLGEA